jgi:hypothetical protein
VSKPGTAEAAILRSGSIPEARSADGHIVRRQAGLNFHGLKFQLTGSLNRASLGFVADELSRACRNNGQLVRKTFRSPSICEKNKNMQIDPNKS